MDDPTTVRQNAAMHRPTRPGRSGTARLLAAAVLAAVAVVALPGPGRGADPGPVTGIEPGAVDRTSVVLEARYEVRLRLRFANRSLSASEAILLVNRSGGPIDRVELNTVAARLGRLRLGATTVDGRTVVPTVADQTIVVPLGGVLPDGGTATLGLSFSATFRTGTGGSDWMFSAAGGSLAAYRWLPWVSLARRFDRPNYGDPFITASSPSVTVAVTTDRPARLATNGRRVEINGDVQVFRAANVRDFTFVADRAFHSATATLGPVRVKAYARTSARAGLLVRQASRALARLQPLVGPYPWPVLTIAESAGGYAVESPGSIWIPRGVAASRLPYLVTHEIAHQWFYGLVGNDQALEPFADEAPADFLARYVTGSFRPSRCATDALDRSIYSYTRACYFETIYVQGGRVLDAIRRRMGTPAFFGALRTYLDEHRNGIGGTAALLATLDAATVRDLAAELRARFPRILKV